MKTHPPVRDEAIRLMSEIPTSSGVRSWFTAGELCLASMKKLTVLLPPSVTSRAQPASNIGPIMKYRVVFMERTFPRKQIREPAGLR